MNVDYFKFEVQPWNYAGKHGGQEKTLDITTTINGVKFEHKTVMPGQAPFETELEFYGKLSIRRLQDMIKEQL